MATITKTYGVALAHQLITHPATVAGSVIDVSTILGATVLMYHGFIEATANTNPGSFIVQISGASSGDEDWADIGEFPAVTGTPDDEALTASEPAAEKVLAVASTAGFAAGDKVYIQDAGTVADGEWGMVEQIVTNTSIDLVSGLTNAKDSSDFIFNNAQRFSMYVDCTAVGRIRVIFMHEGATGADVHIKAQVVRGDSIG